jgi:hypothetical protein
VQVATYLEPTRLLQSAGLDRLEARRSDQPLHFVSGKVVFGRVKEDSRLW